MQIIGQPLHRVPDLRDGRLMRVGLSIGRASLCGHVGQEVEQVVQVDRLGPSTSRAGQTSQLVSHVLELCSFLVRLFLETGIEIGGLGWEAL